MRKFQFFDIVEGKEFIKKPVNSITASNDEEGLKAIAVETEGRYFRASDTAALAGVYAEIDRLEPQSGEENYVREVREYYYIPLAAAVVLATLLMLMRRRQG